MTDHICSDHDVIDLLLRTGHLAYPFGSPQELPKEAALPLTHPTVEKAVASYQDFMSECLDPLCLRHHGRPAKHDGVIGAATRVLFAQPRCGCEDYGDKVQPAIGTGSWKGCHDVGDFHAATVYVDDRGLPGFLRPVWDKVWDRTAAAYDEIGLRFTRVPEEGDSNTTISFVPRAPGWIGLAVVGQNESCNSHIWAKFLATYNPDDTVGFWTELVMHELGHNACLQHSRGGIMNPSIMRGLPPSWIDDPSESILRKLYGGEPVGGDDPPDDPDDPPIPGTVQVVGGHGEVKVTDGRRDAAGKLIEFGLPIDILPRAT